MWVKQFFDLLIQFWTYFAFWSILNQEDVGFIRRLGKVQRDMHTGLNWRWPLVESAVTYNGREGTYVLDPQSLRTKDGKLLVVRLKVTCQIVDARAHMMGIYDAIANVQDVAGGELGDAIQAMTEADVYAGEAVKRVSRRVRAQAKKWGMYIGGVQLLDCAPARSLRLWNSTFTSSGQE